MLRIITILIFLSIGVGVNAQYITVETCKSPYKNCPIKIPCVDILENCFDVESVTIDQPCIDARIAADGTIIWQNPNAVHQISSVQVTTGNGGNNAGGNEYIVTFPNIGVGHGYHVTSNGGIVPNSLNEGDFNITSTSINYCFHSGDDGAGVDDAELVEHSLFITGCEKIINNWVPK